METSQSQAKNSVLSNITNDPSIQSDTSMKQGSKAYYEKDDLFLNSQMPNEQKQDDEDESEDEESEEEGIEIDFPRDNAQDLVQFLHRELNNLQNMEDGQKRKFALIKMYQIFVQAKNKAPNRIYQELLPMIQKPLFKRLSDKVEKCREIAALIIKEFFHRSDDITMSIPYILPILVERLNAENLEGTEGLPDVMKPPITQKPQVMVAQTETSEEVRVVLAEIVTVIVSQTVFDCLRAYVDQLVNIVRALCMDPFGDVIIEGCNAMSELAQNGTDQLLHFSENMGRSLFTSFVSKHAKVRMAGIKALYQVFFCGVWKYNANIMEHLIGFRDPNLVPIRDFYDVSTKLNYFAILVSDRSTVVRDLFYKTIAGLSMKLPDKKDHEGRLFPYLISGLYDHNDVIRESVFDLIEELGKQYEEEYEKDIRELKQLGFNPEWTFNGKVKDSDVTLPLPFIHRPCLGSRILVRSYVRRYLHALYKEITDWIQENRERASNLLLCCIIYTEDFMTQFMDHLLLSLYKAVLDKENKVVMKNIPLCLKLIGRYCAPRTYDNFILQAIRSELQSYLPHTQAGALKAFGYVFYGAVEIIPNDENLDKVDNLLSEFVRSVNEQILDSLDQELADNLIYSLSQIIEILSLKQEKEFNIKQWQKHEKDFFYMIIRCLGVYHNLKMLNKPDSDHVIEQKKLCIKLLNNLTQVSSNPEVDFFESNLRSYFNEQFETEEVIDKARNWAILNHRWRMFYAVFEFLEDKHFQYYLDSDAKITIQDRVGQIISAILKNGDSQNYNVKYLALTQLLPMFVNKSIKIVNPNLSLVYLNILQQAALTEWKNPDQKLKNLVLIQKQHHDLLDLEGVKLNAEVLEKFDEFMLSFEIFHKLKKDSIRVETLKIIRRYLDLFITQIVTQKGLNSKLKLFSKLKFISQLSEELIKYLTDYHDSVREQAQLLLTDIIREFLPQELQFDQEQDQLLQMLRSNASVGFSSQMTQKLKDAAEMESAMTKHAFDDPQAFIKNIVAIMMDETHGRENLILIIKEFNKKTPFMVLNDYRIAYQSNSLRRVEILKTLIFQ
ncbi:UNKNOWN [Stylonychia lemnae]|uniref:Armadillo-type fold n=1 Tax=Stylonychia lemnae TaxID=5949 RepID=A0A078AFR6_STYLE|nr:UNKNOWN [Stylonychia lemnae]|eukprot:CDW81095.1 UNKNOWN [Stylonychia lemnae]